MDTLEIYNRVRQVPDEAKKQIRGGRLNGFTDINPMWRIKCLTEQFGPAGFGWYIEEVDRWTEACGAQVAAFVKIHLFIKMGGEWSRPIVGIGGSMLVAQEKQGLYFSDEAFKMAYTDAISVACKALGIGADVYYEKDRTKYDMPVREPVPARAASHGGKSEPNAAQMTKALGRISAGELDMVEKMQARFFLTPEQYDALQNAVADYKVNNNIK